MIFWIILIILQLINMVMLFRMGKGNNFVRVEHKHVYIPAEKQHKKHGGKYDDKREM